MKKTLKTFYVLAAFFVAALSSCSTQSDDFATSLEENGKGTPSLQFDNLCASIDSLNATYVGKASVSLAKPRKISDKTVAKWTRRVITACVDGCGGAFGGLIGGFIASAVYDEYMDYCIDKINHPRKPRRIVVASSTSCPAYVYADGSKSNFEDSVGYYHNKALEALASKGKQYVVSEDSIDFQGLYDDCLDIIDQLGVRSHVDAVDRDACIAVTDTMVRAFYQCYDEELTIDEAYARSNQVYAVWQSDISKVTAAETVQNKMLEVLQELSTEQEVVEYADALNALYKKAEIEPELKRALKTVTNMTICSTMYWGDFNTK